MRNAKFQSQPGSNCDSDRLVVKLIIIIIIIIIIINGRSLSSAVYYNANRIQI